MKCYCPAFILTRGLAELGVEARISEVEEERAGGGSYCMTQIEVD